MKVYAVTSINLYQGLDRLSMVACSLHDCLHMRKVRRRNEVPHGLLKQLVAQQTRERYSVLFLRILGKADLDLVAVLAFPDGKATQTSAGQRSAREVDFGIGQFGDKTIANRENLYYKQGYTSPLTVGLSFTLASLPGL